MWGKESPILKEKSGTLVRIKEYWPQYLLAFLFPTLTVLAAMAITGCYPFGERTMLTVDLYHQYCPFLVAFRDKFWAGESLFYSWNDGLGQEFYAAYANYAASPLNIFAIFFDAKTMPVFIMFVTCLRAGLASLFMLLFLSANDNKRLDNITVVFSASYALCGWYISYFWNIMWCDAVVLLPLIMFGLRRLLVERKCGVYSIALAFAIFSNYYAGYFICVFLVLFAPLYYICLFSRDKKKGDPGRLCIKTFAGAALRFAVSSILAAGATAAVTIPTYLILGNCSATGDKLTMEYNLKSNLFDFLGRLMVAANPNIRDGMANVYSGLVIVLLLPLFFMLPARTGIKTKHKVVFGSLIAIMYISFSNRTLDFIWHGMHFPNQIPYRQAFLMSFLLVFVGFLTIRRIRSLGAKYITGTVMSSAAFLILYEKFGTGNEGYLQIGVTLAFLIVQGVALHIVSDPNSRKSEFFCETLLTVTMMVEIFAASQISIGLVCYHEGFTSYAPYGRNKDAAATYVESIEGSEGHMNFERTEIYPNNVCDVQSLYNIKGLSIFSSTAREDFVVYMRNYGLHNNGINGLRNSGLTRVTATLLNVRNIVEVDKTQMTPALFEKEYSDGVITSWGNPDALSVGYMTDAGLVDYMPDYSGNPDVFDKTNQWITSMGAGNVYKQITITPVKDGTPSGLVTDDRPGPVLVYGTTSSSKLNDYSFTIRVNDAEIGSDVYVYANAQKGGTATITIGDNVQTFETRSYQIISLGVYDGTPMELNLKYREEPGGSIFLYGYQLDREGYDHMLEVLSDEQLQVTDYDSTSLNGHIEVKEDGLLFLTIPYAEGWTAEVDGEAAEIVPIQDALMGIRLGKGSHDVSIRYVPAGFKPGSMISVTSIILIAAISLIPALIRRKKAAVVATNVAVPENNGVERPSAAIEEVALEEVSESEAEITEQTAESSALTEEPIAEEYNEGPESQSKEDDQPEGNEHSEVSND